jgi:hypothetical protein
VQLEMPRGGLALDLDLGVHAAVTDADLRRPFVLAQEGDECIAPSRRQPSDRSRRSRRREAARELVPELVVETTPIAGHRFFTASLSSITRIRCSSAFMSAIDSSPLPKCAAHAAWRSGLPLPSRIARSTSQDPVSGRRRRGSRIRRGQGRAVGAGCEQEGDRGPRGAGRRRCGLAGTLGRISPASFRNARSSEHDRAARPPAG